MYLPIPIGIIPCELFRQGHGIKQERENIAKMIAFQMKHREKREEKHD